MSDWQKRQFGATGLTVSALGFGAGQIGDPALAEDEVENLLNSVLDLGITLIDTARGYSLSEERIGRHLARRRQEFVLSTKVGYDIPGYADWTGAIITAGIDAALRRLQTDYIDIVHLHSCSLEVLQQGEVITALLAAVAAGKVRVAAYSGDNEPLAWSVNSRDANGHSLFGSIETSINFCNQRVIDDQLAVARARNLGVIAKRPIANAPWRFAERPVGHYAEVYWERAQAMRLDELQLDMSQLALRFTAFLPGVHSCIVGTRNLQHLRENVQQIEEGALSPATVEAIREAFRRHDQNWLGEV